MIPTVLTSLLLVTWICSSNAQGPDAMATISCYACTYRKIGSASTGDSCNDAFQGTSNIVANITCDSSCVKRITQGGVFQIKRGCYADVGQGLCEDYVDQPIPNSDPPQTMTQTCCNDQLCNYGNINTPMMCLYTMAILYALFMK
ncbi:uncharacterized protein [Asterias amurensis]|uniref:uncharacterized protein n=1 Tax=Asterias amurensis TaxID=7602 RepID=UPI003AB3E8AC